MSKSRDSSNQNFPVDSIAVSLTTDAFSIRNPIVSHLMDGEMKIFDVRYSAEQTYGNALAQAGSESLSYQD